MELLLTMEKHGTLPKNYGTMDITMVLTKKNYGTISTTIELRFTEEKHGRLPTLIYNG